jgi:hypothetical protein
LWGDLKMKEDNDITNIGVAQERGKSSMHDNHRHEPVFIQSEARYQHAQQVSLRPRERFWDVTVPQSGSAFDNLII